jgi:ubiquitin C-terminal hydrolase
MVHEVSHICRIDSITDKLREFLVPVKTQNKKEFKCETCNKEFPTEHALKIHNTKKHS